MSQIVVIAHNLRSAHNVGSLLRTCEGLGVDLVLLTGYTPYPASQDDDRLPHITQKINHQISKTALGAETSQAWRHSVTIEPVIQELRKQGFVIAALEQSADSIQLPRYHAPSKIAFIIGREVEGVEVEILSLCDDILEIPMFGQKESFNVIQAAAMALYQVRFINPASAANGEK